MVTPFAAKPLQTAPDAAAQDDAATAARTEDHAENDAVELVARGTEAGFGDREAIGVVLERHGLAQALAEILAKGPAVEACGVGVLDQAADAADRTWHADPHRDGSRIDAGLARRLLDQAARGFEDGVVASIAFGRDAPAGQNLEGLVGLSARSAAAADIGAFPDLFAPRLAPDQAASILVPPMSTPREMTSLIGRRA
jgi:hypothetical protein